MADTPAVPAAPATKWWVVPGYGYIAVGLFGFALIYVLTHDMDKYQMLMLGAIIAMVNQGPWSFFFGSSASSEKKTDIIAGAAPSNGQPTPAESASMAQAVAESQAAHS